MAKLRNISYIVKEIAINSSTTNYELNGIVGNNLEFYGLDKITGNYKELPKAWYQLIKNNGNYVFKVVDPSIFNYSKIQIALWYDNKSLTYVTEFNPDIKVLVDRYNILVSTVSQLWEYTKRQMIVGDSMEMHLILPKLKSEELWICKGDHYEAISLVDVNAELKKIIDRYAEQYKLELQGELQRQKQLLSVYVDEQKNILDIYKDDKIQDLLNKLNLLKIELDNYLISKENEMDSYKERLQNDLYEDSKNKINEYTDERKNLIYKQIKDKADEILDNLKIPIKEEIELRIDVLFKTNSPRYLDELKLELDSYVNGKKSILDNYIEDKVNSFIATKDELIKQKIEDIATTQINEAVKKAKDNVLKEINDNISDKVNNAVDNFTNQANALTTQKLKDINDAVTTFINTNMKTLIENNVNDYMSDFNVNTSNVGGKIKLIFSLKSFNKEIEIPNGELPNGDILLQKINNDITKDTQSFKDFKDKFEIPPQIDVSGKVDKIEDKPLIYKGALNGVNLNDLFKPNESYGIYNEVRNYTSTAKGYPAQNEAGVLLCYPIDNGIAQQWISYFTGKIYTRAKVGAGGISAWKEISSDSGDLRIKFNSNNSATFLSNQEQFYFNPESISGNAIITSFHFTKGNVQSYADVHADTFNAKKNVIAGEEIISNGDITAFSDVRLKSNIKRIDDALNKIMQISGYTYVMNNKKHSGVIAQEVEKVLPEVVQDREDGYKTIAYGNMVGLLIEAIKDLKKEIDDIKVKLND